jgi:hypothetical protein
LLAAKKGYAKNGNGSDNGVNGRQKNMCTATTVNRSAAINPTPLTSAGIALGELTRASEAAHKATPAANDGALATKSKAAPERISPLHDFRGEGGERPAAPWRR